MDMFYTTIENQLREDGSYGLLYDHFTEKEAALAKYFTICAAASISEIPYHSAHLLQSDGHFLRQEIFDRRAEFLPEEEPMPESGEEETTPEVEEETDNDSE